MITKTPQRIRCEVFGERDIFTIMGATGRTLS
jgi:hypothetical protein